MGTNIFFPLEHGEKICSDPLLLQVLNTVDVNTPRDEGAPVPFVKVRWMWGDKVPEAVYPHGKLTKSLILVDLSWLKYLNQLIDKHQDLTELAYPPVN